MNYVVNLEKFHGPFDVLFYLIESNEMNIYDIQISIITQQYIDFLEEMEIFDMEITCDFLIMASTLLEIKSSMLLPQNNIESDPREELVHLLIEYKKYKELSMEIQKLEESESLFITKSKEEIIIEQDIDKQLVFNETNVVDLLNILKYLYKNLDITHNLEEEYFSLIKEEYSVKDCIDLINEQLIHKNKINIMELLVVKSKKYLVVLFLSLLEMSNLKTISLFQEKIFGDIFLLKTSGVNI